MYRVRLECPQDSTNRSRPGQCGSDGSCRITFWYSRYATGARLIAVPGWPLPTFCTASAASSRTVSMACTSRSVQPSGKTGAVAWREFTSMILPMAGTRIRLWLRVREGMFTGSLSRAPGYGTGPVGSGQVRWRRVVPVEVRIC